MEDKTVVTTAPPPPSEVKIRTMRSDLESMRKSGGGPAKFQNVVVSGLSIEKAEPQVSAAVATAPAVSSLPGIPSSSHATPIADPVTATAPIKSSNEHLVAILIVVLVAILALGGVGYFAYITFFAK